MYKLHVVEFKTWNWNWNRNIVIGFWYETFFHKAWVHGLWKFFLIGRIFIIWVFLTGQYSYFWIFCLNQYRQARGNGGLSLPLLKLSPPQRLCRCEFWSSWIEERSTNTTKRVSIWYYLFCPIPSNSFCLFQLQSGGNVSIYGILLYSCSFLSSLTLFLRRVTTNSP